MLNGFVFSTLTIAPESDTLDAAGFVDRLPSAFLEQLGVASRARRG